MRTEHVSNENNLKCLYFHKFFHVFFGYFYSYICYQAIFRQICLLALVAIFGTKFFEHLN